MCPDLVDAVEASDADVIACYPYLFATTVDAISAARVPVVLHPAAHDEPALYFAAFRRSFKHLDGLVYHTRAERDLMEDVFAVGALPQVVLDSGSMTRQAPVEPEARSLASVTGPTSPTWVEWTSTRVVGC